MDQGALDPVALENSILMMEAALTLDLESLHRSNPVDRTWYDQRLDLFGFRQRRVARWPERGVFGRQALEGSGIKTLVDLGSGPGFFAYHFWADKVGKVICVDHDQDAHRLGTQIYRLPNIERVQAQIEDLKFPDPPCAVFAYGIFEEIEDRETLLAKIRKATTGGGVFCGSVILLPECRSLHAWNYPDQYTVRSKILSGFVGGAVWTTSCHGRVDTYWMVRA